MKAVRQILVIEDDANDQVPLLLQLTDADLKWHVEIIPGSAEAVAFLTDEQFNPNNTDAIFLDFKLLKIGGLRLLEAIRTDHRLLDIPIIVMTSSIAPVELEECRKLGVFSFVQKPLTLSSFTKALSDISSLGRRAPWTVER